MKIKHIHQNIVRIRKAKGYSHEYMAIRLDISQAAYCKLEHNKTKLYIERLYQIADILEVGVAELLSINPKFKLTQNTEENIQHTQKLLGVYEARIRDKDLFINSLQESIKKSGEHEKAMRVLVASVDASQTNEELLEHYSYMAWNYLYFYRDYHNTLKIVDEIMQLSNNDFGASCYGESCLILKGQALYRSGKLDEAIEVFEAYQAHEEKLGFSPMDDPLLVFYKGRCLAEKEEYEKAIPYFTYFTRHQPSAEAYFQLAHLFLQLNFKEDARLYINLAEEALQNGYTFREPYFERFDKVFMHQIEAFKHRL